MGSGSVLMKLGAIFSGIKPEKQPEPPQKPKASDRSIVQTPAAANLSTLDPTNLSNVSTISRRNPNDTLAEFFTRKGNQPLSEVEVEGVLSLINRTAQPSDTEMFPNRTMAFADGTTAYSATSRNTSVIHGYNSTIGESAVLRPSGVNVKVRNVSYRPRSRIIRRQSKRKPLHAKLEAKPKATATPKVNQMAKLSEKPTVTQSTIVKTAPKVTSGGVGKPQKKMSKTAENLMRILDGNSPLPKPKPAVKTVDETVKPEKKDTSKAVESQQTKTFTAASKAPVFTAKAPAFASKTPTATPKAPVSISKTPMVTNPTVFSAPTTVFSASTGSGTKDEPIDLDSSSPEPEKAFEKPVLSHTTFNPALSQPTSQFKFTKTVPVAKTVPQTVPLSKPTPLFKPAPVSNPEKPLTETIPKFSFPSVASTNQDLKKNLPVTQPDHVQPTFSAPAAFSAPTQPVFSAPAQSTFSAAPIAIQPAQPPLETIDSFTFPTLNLDIELVAAVDEASVGLYKSVFTF